MRSLLLPVIWLRSILATLYLVCATLFLGLIAIFSALMTGRQDTANVMIRWWASSCLWFFNVRLCIRGLENIPDGGYLFLFNHSSDLDILAIYGGVRPSARFGAKIELFKIPIFGQILRATKSLPIARGDRDRVLQLYAESVPRVHAGEQFLLAAEGTRQPVPGVGEKFKAGPFIFAIAGQFPIVPIVLRGAAECLPKGRWLACSDRWQSFIHIEVLAPISTKGWTVDNRAQLQESTRIQMTEAYHRQGV